MGEDVPNTGLLFAQRGCKAMAYEGPVLLTHIITKLRQPPRHDTFSVNFAYLKRGDAMA